MSLKIMKFLMRAMALFPMPALYLLSDVCFVIVYYLIGYRKKVVRENLCNSFPEWSEARLKETERKFYRHFCDLLVETVALSGIPTKKLLKRVEFENTEVIDHYFEKQRFVTTVLGHLGNWEWFSVYQAVCPYDCVVIYKPLSNPTFNQVIVDLRSRHGYRPVAMQNVLREYIQAKNENRVINAFFIADQSPMKHEIRFRTRFLNQDTPIFNGTEKIAKKFNAVIVYVHILKPSRGRYKLRFEPLFDNLDQVSENEITLAHVRRLEENILEQPEIWLWSHRRWKHKANPTPEIPT